MYNPEIESCLDELFGAQEVTEATPYTVAGHNGACTTIQDEIERIEQQIFLLDMKDYQSDADFSLLCRLKMELMELRGRLVA